MKKIILGIAIAGLAISCQKVQAVGNTGILKMENGTERYSDDVMSDEATAKVQQMQATKMMEDSSATTTIVQPVMEVKKDSMTEMSTTPAAATTEMK